MPATDEYDLAFEIEGRASSSEKESILKDPSMIGIGMVGIGISIGIFALVNQPPPPPPVVHSVASVLEEWSVEHPHKELVETREFTVYDSYVAGISDGESFKEAEEFSGAPEEVMIRVSTYDGTSTNQSNVVGFKVCAYKTDGLTLKEHKEGQKEIFSFDSTTGEVKQTNLEECITTE